MLLDFDDKGPPIRTGDGQGIMDAGKLEGGGGVEIEMDVDDRSDDLGNGTFDLRHGYTFSTGLGPSLQR